MKKRIVSIVAILLMAVGATNAQVFMLENEEEISRAFPDPSDRPFIPDLGETNDQGYAPVGSGALLLAGLAGVYLLGKKKEKKEISEVSLR